MNSEARFRTLSDLYEALNRNDIPGALKSFDTNCTRIEWQGTPSERSFHGIEEVREHFREGRETWAEGSCSPKKFQEVGDHVIVSVQVHVKLKKNQEWVKGDVADVFLFREDRIIHFQSFLDEQDALTWVRR